MNIFKIQAYPQKNSKTNINSISSPNIQSILKFPLLSQKCPLKLFFSQSRSKFRTHGFTHCIWLLSLFRLIQPRTVPLFPFVLHGTEYFKESRPAGCPRSISSWLNSNQTFAAWKLQVMSVLPIASPSGYI